MESRIAFLFSRFIGFNLGLTGLVEITYIPERIFGMTQSPSLIYQHSQQISVFFLVVRIVINLVLGLFFWTQASRGARWLEGRGAEARSDAEDAPLANPR